MLIHIMLYIFICLYILIFKHKNQGVYIEAVYQWSSKTALETYFSSTSHTGPCSLFRCKPEFSKRLERVVDILGASDDAL